MRPLFLLVAAVMFLCGCRSQPSWSPFCGPAARVPPPATGSYGQPNAYYQGSLQPIPQNFTSTTTLEQFAPGQWKTVSDDKPKVVSASTLDRPVGTGVSSQSTIDADVALTQPKLKGMPINQVRSAVEPAPFTPDANASQIQPSSSSTGSTSSRVRVAGATDSDGSSGGQVSSAVWQTRPISNGSR